jgi:hypothetical protein
MRCVVTTPNPSLLDTFMRSVESKENTHERQGGEEKHLRSFHQAE